MICAVMGESASGKDSVQQRLVSVYGFIPIVSSTTRAMREGEQEGVDYYYISEQEFKAKIASGAIFEHRAYESSKGVVYYGAEKIDLDPEKNYVTVLDPDGVKEYIKAYGRENVFNVYVTAPDEVRYERAFNRANIANSESAKEEFDREFCKRLADDKKRFSADEINGICNFTISNTESLEKTVSTIIETVDLYDFRMQEYRDRIPLHTDMDYPQLIIRNEKDGMYCFSSDKCTKRSRLAWENLESLGV